MKQITTDKKSFWQFQTLVDPPVDREGIQNCLEKLSNAWGNFFHLPVNVLVYNTLEINPVVNVTTWLKREAVANIEYQRLNSLKTSSEVALSLESFFLTSGQRWGRTDAISTVR